MIRLGLTGGIGSGKSTVSTMLARLGVAVIDADAVSRDLTAPQGQAIASIQAEFGDELITADGSLNRQKMRDLVFNDPNAKKRLEKILHPLIKLEIQKQDDAAAAAGKNSIVYDIPLLVESAHWRTTLDKIMVVDCLEETQIQRVILRNTLLEVDIKKIIVTQASRKKRNSAADVLIFNDSISIQQLQEQVTQLAQVIMRPA
jgi:dephospho-CoA kinase